MSAYRGWLPAAGLHALGDGVYVWPADPRDASGLWYLDRRPVRAAQAWVRRVAHERYAWGIFVSWVSQTVRESGDEATVMREVGEWLLGDLDQMAAAVRGTR